MTTKNDNLSRKENQISVQTPINHFHKNFSQTLEERNSIICKIYQSIREEINKIFYLFSRNIYVPGKRTVHVYVKQIRICASR